MSMDDLNLDFSPSVERIPKNTPTSTRQIELCVLTFTDGSTLELPVDDANGFYRVSEYMNKGKGFVNHEVFIAYSHTKEG
jgi:hypothetical protein